MTKFDIPVVLLIFKRKDKIKRIIERIEMVQPAKVYILADGPRNKEEEKAVKACRAQVESSITWECEIIKRYSDVNRGVYKNIGEGAKWVFEREEYAIFLEDDNLPQSTFFPFCKELLEKYRNDNRILWICGTNYLEEYEPENGFSYVFTKHLMPCGWASWKDKFLKYYDGKLALIEDENAVKTLKASYADKKLYAQQFSLMKHEKKRIDKGLKPMSWDYQMEFAVRANGLYGISPKYNQIENIGVDQDSIHGGSDSTHVMIERFCSITSTPLEFPLEHPASVLPDSEYEKKVGKIILYPLGLRITSKLSTVIRAKLNTPDGVSLKKEIKRKIYKSKVRNYE